MPGPSFQRPPIQGLPTMNDLPSPSDAEGPALFEGFADRIRDGALIGWARRAGSLEPVTVHLHLHGERVASVLADRYRDDLEAAGKGQGRHGFEIRLPDGRLPDGRLDGLRVAIAGAGDLPMSAPLRCAIDDLSTAAAADPAVGTAAVWLDLSEFLFYLRTHKTLSGIQRVQCEIVRIVAGATSSRVRFCMTPPEGGEYVEVPTAVVGRLVDRLTGNAPVPLADWSAYVGMIADPARRAKAAIAPGQMLFVLGAFWVFPHTPALLAVLRGRGVHIGVCVYDLIPLYHPEYCDPGMVGGFLSAFSTVSQVADLILTISHHTAADVERFYRRIGQPPKTIRPVPLAHELTNGSAAAPGGGAGPSPLLRLIGGPFVLCVGTIEIRKNHGYLLAIWQELLRRHGPEAVPKLVLAGRRGWRVEGFYDALETTRSLDRHVLLIDDADDADLEALYRGCLFTVFPSLYEGWGLPVGESLMHGKLCITSRSSAMPEAGGEFAAYLDPRDQADGLRTIEAFLFDDARRARMEEAIRTRFVPRRWSEVVNGVFSEIQAYLAGCRDGGERPPPVSLKPGAVVRLRRLDRLNGFDDMVRRPPFLRLICAQGWHPSDGAGAWMDGPNALLSFGLDTAGRPAPARLRVHLHVFRPAWARDAAVTVTSACGASATTVLEDDETMLSLDCAPVAMGGPPAVRIAIALDRLGAPPSPETRRLGLLAKTVAVADADDALQRLDVVEKLLFLMRP